MAEKKPRPHYNLKDLLGLPMKPRTKLVMLELLRIPGPRSIYDVAEVLSGPKTKFQPDWVLSCARELHRAEIAYLPDHEHVQMIHGTPWGDAFKRVAPDQQKWLTAARAVSDLETVKEEVATQQGRVQALKEEYASLHDVIRKRTFLDEHKELETLKAEIQDAKVELAKLQAEAAKVPAKKKRRVVKKQVEQMEAPASSGWAKAEVPS